MHVVTSCFFLTVKNISFSACFDTVLQSLLLCGSSLSMMGEAVVKTTAVMLRTPCSAASHTVRMYGWVCLVLEYTDDTRPQVELTRGRLLTLSTTFWSRNKTGTMKPN